MPTDAEIHARLVDQALVLRKLVEFTCPIPADGLIALLLCACSVAYEQRNKYQSIDNVDDMLRKTFNSVNEMVRRTVEEEGL